MKRKLPHRVYLNQGTFYYVDLSRKWHRLGRTESEMYLALSDMNKLDDDTMNTHFIEYLKTETPKKALTTQKEEIRIMPTLQKTFGSMLPSSIKPFHVYQFHQLRSKQARAGADREKALLSSVCNKLMMMGLVDSNPCHGVKKNGSKPRTRYVTDLEFLAVRKHANSILQAAMDIGLITGLRMGDILNLTRDNLKDDGLYCKTSKTTRALIFNWNERLINAIEHALKHNNDGHYIISNRHGQRYTSSGFKSLFQRTIRKASRIEEVERFQFRDLRTKAACDTKEDATRLLGHSSDKVTKKHYEILPWRITPN